MADAFITQKLATFGFELNEQEVLPGQTVGTELASFPIKPRSLLASGFKAAQWRQHPNTVEGRKIKAR